MTTNAKILTAAFEAGKTAARTRGQGLSGRLRFQGKAREFFEAGHSSEVKVMRAEYQAYLKSPAYQEDRKREIKFWVDTGVELRELLAQIDRKEGRTPFYTY